MDEKLHGFSRQFVLPGAGLDRSGLQDLMRAVRQQVIAGQPCPAADTPAASAFAAGCGDHRDRTHVFIACCRHLGVPARFVSGFVFSAASGQLDHHSWVDVREKDAWSSYDIDTGQRANGIHVRLAVGLDGRDASPVCAVQCDANSSTSFGVLSRGMDPHQQ